MRVITKAFESFQVTIMVYPNVLPYNLVLNINEQYRIGRHHIRPCTAEMNNADVNTPHNTMRSIKEKENTD